MEQAEVTTSLEMPLRRLPHKCEIAKHKLLMLRQIRRLGSSQRRLFQLPASYRPNLRLVQKIPFSVAWKIWWNSLRPNQLLDLQKRLVDHHFPPDLDENSGVRREHRRVAIDSVGNYINEVCFEVTNGDGYETKHVVFLHGYGASLGCFARNFPLVNGLKGQKFNYKVHFLDNISFGLSLNPKVASINYWKPIPRADHITIHDSKPTDARNLYKKYYKLVDGYDFHVDRFRRRQKTLLPQLHDIESYYIDALENWRQSSKITKIDFLVGHSFGGYWSGSYAVRYPENLCSLVLLSPVGVERHAYAANAPIPAQTEDITPSLDPTSLRFLSRYPILSKKTISFWYYVQPYIPRLLKFMGPWGVAKYYDMWYSKLFAVNKVIEKLGGTKVFTSANQLRYGTNTECRLLIEYLYNSITNGTKSDTHIKYLLTPATTSRIPLFDKFASADKRDLAKYDMHVVYGQYDFMNSEAGEKLVEEVNSHGKTAWFHVVPQGGHNLYIQNPFGTNDLLEKIIRGEAKLRS